MTAYIPHILLSLATVLLWIKNRNNVVAHYAWLLTLVFATILSVYVQQLEIIAIAILIAVGFFAWLSGKNLKKYRLSTIAGVAFVIAAVMLGMHLMPGFNSVLVMQNKIITPDAQPYNLYLNFDKVVVGLFILGFIYQRPKDCLNWTQTFSVLLRWLPFVIVAVVAMSLVTGYVRVEPKLIEGLWIWMWVNLLFTCMVEEAFFRGFIQAKLAGLLARHNYSKWIAPTIAAVLFGLTHFAGGGLYVVIAVFAGLGYGIIYTLTGRIEASIIAHFALNLTHMLFFTYPALQ